MDINPRVLRSALMQNMEALNHQIEAVKGLSEEMNTLPFQIKDERGNFVLAPLLVAQANVLHALALLQSQRRQ